MNFKDRAESSAIATYRRIERRYFVESHIFRTSDEFVRYGEAIEGLRSEMRSRMASARLWHFQYKVLTGYKSQAEYSGTIALLHLPPDNIEALKYFDQKMKEIFRKFGMQYRLFESS